MKTQTILGLIAIGLPLVMIILTALLNRKTLLS